jgi:[ribosomal protein S5]-alanine N-acetyltransferase
MTDSSLVFASALGGALPFPSRATQRLVLREFESDDLAAIWRIFSNEAVTSQHNVRHMHEHEEAQALLDWRIEQWPSGRGVRWAIAPRERPRESIGSCGFDFQRRRHGAIELSYDLDPAHWRQGFAREALASAIDCAFEGHLGIEVERIEALTRPGNQRSERLLGALGFHPEGVLRRFRHWRNEAVDLACWSRLRADPTPR